MAATCPRCNNQMDYIGQYNIWHCPNCQHKILPDSGAGPFPSAQPPAPVPGPPPLQQAPVPYPAGPAAGFLQPPQAAAQPQPPQPARKLKHSHILSILSGLLLVAGAFLPWATLSNSLGASYTITGIEADGIFTIVIGAVIVLVSYLLIIRKAKGKKSGIGLFVVGLVALVIGAIDTMGVNQVIEEKKSVMAQSGIAAHVGIGLYLTLIGGILALIAGIWVFFEREKA